MSKSPANSVIRLRGIRHNNLKNFDLDLPLNQLIVITGLSGSGKSSLAFDTLFAEGQRRYIETFSPYARQFFDRMDKPRVDSIEGIPPAIAIEQRNAVKTTRSTVGTMTEICDYMKLLWPRIAQLYCRQCGQPVRKDSTQQIWQALSNPELRTPNSEFLITFDLPLTEKLSLEESLGLIAKQGYQRLLVRADKAAPRLVAMDESRFELNEAIAPWGTIQAGPAPAPPQEGSYDPNKPHAQFPSWEGLGAGSRAGGAVSKSDFQIVRIDEAMERLKPLKPSSLTVVQDRLKLTPTNRARFVEACEHAYHFGKGKLSIHSDTGSATRSLSFSSRLHCARCDIEYREPSAALFSFNHPLGACPTCRGFGRIISIDYHLALPDRTKSLAEGVVKPWLTGHGLECQEDMIKFCKIRKVPTDVPFERLPKKRQDWVVNGDPDYGKDEDHEWPRAWYGVKGYFRWLESKAYKMHVRVLLSRYRSYTPCPDCHGNRFQPESLLYRVTSGVNPRLTDSGEPAPNLQASIGNSQPSTTLAEFYQLPIRDALHFVEQIAANHQPKPSDPIGLVLGEVRSRLRYLVEVGLGYLTLDRPTRSLSGGETERVNLTTCLGTRLVNTLYVLDEPSVGLHPRDTGRLITILEQLRDLGNTVVVVEHEASVIRAADQIVDLGPGHGESGGRLVFQGSHREILKSKESLTGQYLSGRKQVGVPPRRRVGRASRLSGGTEVGPDTDPVLTLAHASLHNLKDLTVEIPLARFVCVTGVSGSGKTTLMREVLLPELESKLKSQIANQKAADRRNRKGSDKRDDEDDAPSTISRQSSTHLTGWECLGRVVLVDQSPLGKTPRSNPAVYVGAFDDTREFFAETDAARQRGLNASAFSFNSTQGQCERCRGAGFEKIEMQFLSDVFIRCPDCDGRRYRPHILEVKVVPSALEGADLSALSHHARSARDKPTAKKGGDQSPHSKPSPASWSIADLLDATVDAAIGFLGLFADSRPAQRAGEKLKLLQEVGLGYLRLGQPINTLSGGESQRLKLVTHLAESVAAVCDRRHLSGPQEEDDGRRPPLQERSTLFLFDEPTTGLHFDDIRVLLRVFQRLVDAGHSVVVIEHNLEVIKSADWVIDLGPDAGDEGGQIVAQGTPEDLAGVEGSHTARFLQDLARTPSTAPQPAFSLNKERDETKLAVATGSKESFT